MTKRSIIVAALLATVAVGTKAGAHSGHSGAQRARLGELPPELDGMVVELHDTVAPQLVVSNRTGRRLEVLDANGEPFLRIDDTGVSANVTSTSWFDTWGPSGIRRRPPEGGSQEARWIRVGQDPHWGWFDKRIRAAPGASTEGWEIPIRVDGDPSHIRGVFEPAPVLKGRFSAGLVSPRTLAPGVSVSLVPGRVPGILLANGSGKPVEVLGRDGEPFLRIGPDGVEANHRSPLWIENARARNLSIMPDEPGGTGPRWGRVAAGTRYLWLDFRGLYPYEEPPPDVLATAGPADVLDWSVPVRIGDRTAEIRATTRWHPAVARDGVPGFLPKASARR